MTTIRVDKNVEIAMRDGTVLRADVWRPDDSEAYPALIERTPYQKERSAGNDFLRPLELAEAGYAVVIQDTCGRFASDGEWDGIMFHREGFDAYDTVEWVADQPWCDGKVALWGASYAGSVVWLGAFLAPPHLKAIVPMISTEPETTARRMGGTLPLELLVNWFIIQIASDVVPKLSAAGDLEPETMAKVEEALRNPRVLTDPLPLKENPYLSIPGSPLTADSILRGIPPVPFPLSNVNVPALIIGSWYDPGSHVELFEKLRAVGGGGPDVRREHRLIVGPWTHAVSLPSQQGELNFGTSAIGRPVVVPAVKAFLDRHLKGHDGDVAPIRYFLMGRNEWCEADEWPPPGVAQRSWHLRSGGDARTADGDGWLDPEAPKGEERPDTYTYDPADPVPSHGGKPVPLGTAVAGPVNQQHLESRPDVLCYTSEVFDAPSDILGPVVMRLYSSSSARDTDFFVKLTDVFPDGRSIVVCDGCIRARFRKGFDQEVLLEPGSIEAYEIDLAHTAWHVGAGHRLRVQIASSSFPYHDRNMNTGKAVGDDAVGVRAEQSVFHDAAHPSRLELHVATGS